MCRPGRQSGVNPLRWCALDVQFELRRTSMDKSGRTLALTLTDAALLRKLLIINRWRYGDSNPRPSIANETLYQLSYTPNVMIPK